MGNEDMGGASGESSVRMRPIFRTRAVFSDESRYYRQPFEPKANEDVKVRIRTMRNNVDEIHLISGSLRQKMYVAETRDDFDYYETVIHVYESTVLYYFELSVEGQLWYYNKMGITRDLAERNAFRIMPGFTVPEWSNGAVIYQIYVDRFRNGDPDNDVMTREYAYLGDIVRKVEDWNTVPASFDVRNFYGGDLVGVREKLDYLQDLGVDVIYLNPIFVSPSNHKYDTQDYDHVDPHLTGILKDGGELLPWGDLDNRDAARYIRRTTDPDNLEAADRYLADLIEEIHARGMRIILDGVFNHCGSFNKWIDRERIYEKQAGYEKGAYVDCDSPYHYFFKFYNEHAWPYNEFYDGWWGHETLPKLNYEESRALFAYMMHIGRKWVSPPFNADGWRLDVAADLGHTREFNHYFWKEFRKIVREANPNAIILAEHYGDAGEWLRGDEWDTVMNYDAFMEPVSWFLTGMEKHSDEFSPDLLGNGKAFHDAMRYHMASFMGSSLRSAMNELDNHDHSRFLTRTNHRVGRVSELGPAAAGEGVEIAVLRQAVVIQMTFVGAPTLYYGDEAGVVGFTDPDNRRTYPWGEEDRDLLEFYKEAIALHKSSPAFLHGSIKELGCGYHYIAYSRFTDTEQYIIVVNAGAEPVPVEIPVWEAGLPRTGTTELTRVFMTQRDGYTTEQIPCKAISGILTLDMPANGAVVLWHKR